MKKVLLLVVLFALSSVIYAQKVTGIVKGTLKDSTSNQSVSDATVSLMNTQDSSLISFTLTSSSGYFEMKNIAAGNYLIMATFEGLAPLQKGFSITAEKPEVDLGIVKMHQEFKMMDGVVITSQPPIRVNGDTIAYNAGSFKTKPNASVEDLLKKLPGMQVDKDGTVKAQGETVQKVYVDGKEFFGNDPKLATRNLTADMIEQVELYDDQSDQAKFTGMDDGTRSKSINLKLKKDKKKGIFGKASAGYGALTEKGSSVGSGNDPRYEGNLSANYFNGAKKISVISRANNTNNIGFSNNDMLGIAGGGGSGITSNGTAGLNYSDLIGKNLDLTGSYFYNHTLNENLSLTNTVTTWVPRGLQTGSLTKVDSVVTTNSNSSSRNSNDNHRVNLRLNYSIDSVSSIIYTPSFNYQSSNSNSSSNSIYTAMEDYRDAASGNGALTQNNLGMVMDNSSNRNNGGNGLNWSNNLLYRRKLRKMGRTFSVNLSNSINTSDRDGFSHSRRGDYTGNSKTGITYIDQESIQKTNSNSYGINLSYTEPVGRNKMLEFNYGYNMNKNQSDREVYDSNLLTHEYDLQNISQTNQFNNQNESNRIGSNFRVVKKKYNYQFGLSAQRTTLISDNQSKNTKVDQTFINFFPTGSFNYQFARSKNLRVYYRGRTSQPGTSQLQDITINNNGVSLTRGNPSLKQEYSNNLTVNYNSFSMTTFRNFFMRASFSNTNNQIVNSIITDSAAIVNLAKLTPQDSLRKGAQLTIPVNANGAYNASVNFNLGFPIQQLQGGNFNTSTSVNYSRNVSFIDAVRNYTKNLSVGERLRLNYNYKDKLDLGISADVNYNSIKNTLQKSQRQNSSYYVYGVSGEASYIFPKNFILSSDIDYNTNTGLASGYNQSYYLWNASFSKQMLKNNRGELKLSVFDILKQNRSIRRTFSDNSISDVQNTVLQRYFLLSFTYNLNRMGGNSGGGVRGGGGSRGGGGRMGY